MLKYEFENISGIEVTDKDYELIEKMYNATDLDKRDFIKLLNLKAFKKPEPKREVIRVGKERICDNRFIIGYLAEVIDIDIRTGKTVVKRVSEDSTVGDAWWRCDLWERDVIVKK